MIKQIKPSEIKYIKTREELLACATLTDECVWLENGDEVSSVPDYIKEEEILFVSEEMTFGEVYLETKPMDVEGVTVQHTNEDVKVKCSFEGDSVAFLKRTFLCVKDEEVGYKETFSTALYIYN